MTQFWQLPMEFAQNQIWPVRFGLTFVSATNRLSREKGESQMFRLALLIWIVLGTTLAGVGVTVVVSDASLYDQGMKLIPIAAIAGFVIAIPLSFMISKKIMT